METKVFKFNKWCLGLSDDRTKKWFSRSNMKFFNTKLPKVMYTLGHETYFITAERMNETRPYIYTIRRADSVADSITSLEFQKYSSYKEALQDLENILLELEVSSEVHT